MSTFAEMDIERNYESDPFAGDGDSFEPLGQEAGTQIPVSPAAGASAGIPVEIAGAQPAQAAAGPAAPQNTEAASSRTTETKAESKSPAEDKKAAGDADEDAKRKAHEEAEAKRKAEWEARQAKKKADLQEKINKLAAMSDDEAMQAAMKRVGTDTEKITRRNMKDCVAEYIQTMCVEDPAFARKTMNPLKSMVNCFRYISRKAWEYVQDELKADGITPGQGQNGYGCDIPDDLCYQWAVDYFNDPDAKEDKVEEEKFIPKPYYGKTTKSTAKEKGKKAAPQKKAEKPKTEAKPKAAAESDQLSLGGFMMPEEKAG